MSPCIIFKGSDPLPIRISNTVAVTGTCITIMGSCSGIVCLLCQKSIIIRSSTFHFFTALRTFKCGTGCFAVYAVTDIHAHTGICHLGWKILVVCISIFVIIGSASLCCHAKKVFCCAIIPIVFISISSGFHTG